MFKFKVRDHVHLSRRWLGEPQSPLVHEGMLDIEVILVMEDRNLLLSTIGVLVLVLAIGACWRDGDCGEIDLSVCSCGGGHDYG